MVLEVEDSCIWGRSDCDNEWECRIQGVDNVLFSFHRVFFLNIAGYTVHLSYENMLLYSYSYTFLHDIIFQYKLHLKKTELLSQSYNF